MPSSKWMNQWRIWTGLFLGIALVVTAYVLYSKRRDAIPTVQIIHPTRTTLVDEIKTNGKIEPIDPQVARAQLDAFVTGAFAKEGRPVRHGETILTLDANQVRADLGTMRIQLIDAQERLRKARAGGPPDEKAQLTGDFRQAQVEVDRLQRRQEALEKLLATHASTQDEVSQNAAYLERARAALDVLLKRQRDLADRATLEEQSYSLRVQEVEDRIHLLENKLQSATVTSAIDGTLYSFSLRVGDLARVGDVLAEIADLRRVRLRAFVDESDLGELKLDQPVKITWDAMPERAWTGKTEQIPRQVLARGTRSVGEVQCSVDNDKLQLLPNVNVDVRILVQEKNNALVVPRATVRTELGKHFVLVLDGDRLRRREVLLGMANSASYEIVSGLDEGDQVALSSNLDIKAGTVVRTSETK
jgi:HlyD family secretion protein